MKFTKDFQQKIQNFHTSTRSSPNELKPSKINSAHKMGSEYESLHANFELSSQFRVHHHISGAAAGPPIEWPLWNLPRSLPHRVASMKKWKVSYLAKDVSKWAETFENELSSQNGVEIHYFRDQFWTFVVFDFFCPWSGLGISSSFMIFQRTQTTVYWKIMKDLGTPRGYPYRNFGYKFRNVNKFQIFF